MKKIVLLVFAFLLLLAPAGCSNPDSPQQVELSFGSETAYFSGQEELYPIAGDTPAEGDAVEEAAVTLRAQPAAVLVLTLQYAENAQTLDGLMVKVDGNAPVAVSDGKETVGAPVPENAASTSANALATPSSIAKAR